MAFEEEACSLLVCSGHSALPRWGKPGWQCECGPGASVTVRLSFVKASSNLPALYIISLALVLTYIREWLFVKTQSTAVSLRAQKYNKRNRNKLLFKKNPKHISRMSFMAFVWVRSGSYNWNMCITVWSWQKQCVSQLRVWCYLKHLLLHPASAWRLLCCSAPAGRSLWSSSIKTSSPAKFITARGHEPTHISSNIMLKSDVNFRCSPTYGGREGSWCLIEDDV